jgi:hypothetical protein
MNACHKEASGSCAVYETCRTLGLTSTTNGRIDEQASDLRLEGVDTTASSSWYQTVNLFYFNFRIQPNGCHIMK